ncbi:oxygen-independent coproporphyrinogen III oxidase [Evansella cellulosilytica DSM 2522]|uniref:Heme chaperone HemW n=1 Tax=Evansella cellulosilytica (strain ATCC 21833 / DSM 2522 / FERM P-1141 / JCM 9156 / N-4) TaxID=649639 RepID=E6TW25_EVAC2|nr:radical SAM family heme chaperone HemW [Evansella cellulosilytica]ADU29848.1 oxygen-independent coproporphyrinogen III oxidase [Evansella cellulosilytica DSM 2522]
MDTKAVYVHVPFCEQICHYCDFNKFFLKNQPVDEYLSLCDQEIKNTVKVHPNHAISSIYVGGGTPTSLTTLQLSKLLSSIKENFYTDRNVEWTVEVNPGSVDQEKLEMMREYGVNRLSIGAQTFHEDLLKKIGRDHQREDVFHTIELARKVGFHNLSIDIMFGLPKQTEEQFEETLNILTRLPIEHISAYSLKVEERTVFYQLWNKGKLSLPGEDIEAKMYELLREKMKNNNFNQYEISNFAKNGYESSHNLTYWKNEPYFGIGAGAHSYVAQVRRINHGPLPKYMEAVKETGFPYREEHPVSRKEQMEEEMFMGLRKLAGVRHQDFQEKYHLNIEQAFPGVIQDLIDRGLIQDNGVVIKLTESGLLLGNEVFERFLLNE